MTATLERVDIFSTAFLVIDVNDYLEVRRSDWADVERAGAVVARDGKVYISPDLAEILSPCRPSSPRSTLRTAAGSSRCPGPSVASLSPGSSSSSPGRG